MTKSLLLLGEADVGKSHFGAQLLGRLGLGDGALRMVGAPRSLQPFEGVVSSLNRGLSAPHTSRDLYVESRWSVTDMEGRNIDLVWPDYGGEQLRLIRSERRMPRAWTERVASAAGWIVMVRISHAQLADDVFSRPLGAVATEREGGGRTGPSDQASLVDFLQWLAFVRGAGSLNPIADPPLMLLLSCWDELPNEQVGLTPAEVLRSRMPLVSAFVEANWQPAVLHVMGLSALGQALDDKVVDENFVDRGPDRFGYVVLADGTRRHDLTLSIAALL